MKIFDCTTFYNENLILEARFNILDPYIDKFVIVESGFSHSGEKKKFNFDISNFSKFKDKIIYLQIDREPKNLIHKIIDGKKIEEGENIRINAIKRIAYQRNTLMDGLSEANGNDLILYSDNDEIPNFENFEERNVNNKILIFKQKIFYYKFNLYYDRYDWFGTKGCKKKNLINFEWLRNIKPKKYPFYRLDTFFSKLKYQNIKIINDGGWHFTQLKTPEDIFLKMTNSEDHEEFKKTKISLADIENMVKNKVIRYDHQAKTSEYKFGEEFKLKKLEINHMPKYIQNNKEKYQKWLD